MNASLSKRLFQWPDLSAFGFRIDLENLHVRAEQLRTRMEMYPSLVLSQVILQFLFVFMFWGHASHFQLILWLTGFYALHMAEFILWVMHKNELGTIQECRDWHFRFTFFSHMAGLLWGTAAVVFYPADIGYQSLLICVMLGLVAGAATMNPVHPPALFGYVFCIMIPLILRVMLENDQLHWILSLMLSSFVALVVFTGRGLNKTLVASLQKRFENISLLKQLTEQKAETERARNQLEEINSVLLEHEQKLGRMVYERTAELQQRTEEILAIKDTTILALTSLAETRDNETGNHIRRTQHYVRALALQLRGHPRFKHFLTGENIDMLYKIAPLHDIGKVGIPDRILHKPGKLTQEEFEIMKTHTTLGGNAISGAENMTNVRNSPFLKAARQIAIGHHEKWDGSGYPFALREEHISIPARLMALADVYDAMSCRRIYKSAMGHDEVAEIIIAGKWKHFDPDVVDAFMASMREFKEIAAKYRDVDAGATEWKVAA